MVPKFSLTRDDNIFVAKRNLIDYIWKSAKLEGLGVTYPDTEAIFNGMYPADYPYICQLNRIVGGDNLIINAGFIRKVPVSIGGTSWKPDIPIESQIKEDVANVLSVEEPTDRAITLMLYLMRKQMFLDGNKRTAMLAGNQIMIANGCGVLSVPIEIQPEFTKMLVEYYETGEMDSLKDFVYENCIDGIDFRQNEALCDGQEQDPSDGGDFPTMTM